MSAARTFGEVKEVQLSSGTIRYRESGKGRPIVFVHGFLVDGGLWVGTAAELQSGYRCIVPDWPMGSHELAMNPDADLAPPAMADLVAEFIAALDLHDVVLVGNDSGGAVCQLAITRHPDRIGALVLTPCDCFDKFPPFPYNLMLGAAGLPGGSAMIVNSLRLPPSRWITFKPLMPKGYDGAMVRRWCMPIIADKAVRRDALKFVGGMGPEVTLGVAEKLPEVDQPALIAWGPSCRFFTFEMAKQLEAALPNARIKEIPGTQTFLALDAPEELAEAIGEFAAA